MFSQTYCKQLHVPWISKKKCTVDFNICFYFIFLLIKSMMLQTVDGEDTSIDRSVSEEIASSSSQPCEYVATSLVSINYSIDGKS